MTGEPDDAAAEREDGHDVEVLYTYGPHSEGVEFDEDAEAFAIARDLRGFGTEAFDEFDRDPQTALDTAYDTLFECTVEDAEDVDELLRDVYQRLQGGRVDDQLGYDGSKTRSLGVGDVIRVDGTPYMVDRRGFTELVFEREAEVQEGDNGGILITDGGQVQSQATDGSGADERLPDGWERVESAGPFYKLVLRGAVTVPKRYRGEPFERDAVVIVTDEKAGVTSGPGARSSWDVADPDAAARRLVDVLDEWCAADRDPYGGGELDRRLNEAVDGGGR